MFRSNRIEIITSHLQLSNTCREFTKSGQTEGVFVQIQTEINIRMSDVIKCPHSIHNWNIFAPTFSLRTHCFSFVSFLDSSTGEPSRTLTKDEMSLRKMKEFERKVSKSNYPKRRNSQCLWRRLHSVAGIFNTLLKRRKRANYIKYAQVNSKWSKFKRLAYRYRSDHQFSACRVENLFFQHFKKVIVINRYSSFMFICKYLPWITKIYCFRMIIHKFIYWIIEFEWRNLTHK